MALWESAFCHALLGLNLFSAAKTLTQVFSCYSYPPLIRILEEEYGRNIPNKISGSTNFSRGLGQNSKNDNLWRRDLNKIFHIFNVVVREYRSPATSANCLRGWLHKFKKCGIVAHTSVSGHPSTGTNDVGRIENAFWWNPWKPLRIVRAEFGIPHSKIRNVYWIYWNCSCKICLFTTTPFGRLYSANRVHRDYSLWIEQCFGISGNNCLLWWLHHSYQ